MIKKSVEFSINKVLSLLNCVGNLQFRGSQFSWIPIFVGPIFVGPNFRGSFYVGQFSWVIFHGSIFMGQFLLVQGPVKFSETFFSGMQMSNLGNVTSRNKIKRNCRNTE